MQAAEIVELVIAAVEAGDFARLGPHIAPDGVFRGTVGGLEEAMELHGPTAGIEYFRDVANTWDEWLFKAEEVHGDGERFVIFWHETSRSRGLEIVNETATLLTIRGGQIKELRGYLDREQALEAAGLR